MVAPCLPAGQRSASLATVTRIGSLRASDADRDEIVDRLRRAATEGRIAPDELEQRVQAALKARTYAELDAVVFDLPGHAGRPVRRPSRSRSAAGWALATVRANPILALLALPLLAAVATVLVTAVVMWAAVALAMMAGGCRCASRGPWMYTRHRRPYAPPRSGPRSYWA